MSLKVGKFEIVISQKTNFGLKVIVFPMNSKTKIFPYKLVLEGVMILFEYKLGVADSS